MAAARRRGLGCVAGRPHRTVTVTGNPPQFQGRGLTLSGLNRGSSIELNCGANRLQIDQPGWIELPLDRDLLAGDLFMNWPLNFLGTNPFPFLVQDFNELLTSYRILERTGVQRVFPAHGKPFSFARVKQSLPRLEALAGKRSTGMA